MANGWTEARRARQAQRIHEWAPWAKSTGPRSELGKVLSKRNAWKGGHRPMLRKIARLLGDQRGGLLAGL